MAKVQKVSIAGRPCTNKTILELANKEGSGRPIEDVVREIARRKLAEADELLRQTGDDWSPPPFKPILVAGALRIKCKEVDDHNLDDAMICLENGTPTIRYRRDRSDGRTNFSISHETAHTLFPGYHNTIHYRKPKKRNLFDPGDQLEYLCDIAATELLMPMDYFLPDLKDRGFGASQVSDLCERYGASVEAVCRRMAQSNWKKCALVLFEHQLKPVEKNARRRDEHQLSLLPGKVDYESKKKMRVTYCVPSDDFKKEGWFVPKHKSVRETSCIHQAALKDQLMEAEEDLELGGGTGRFYIEALPVPSRQPLGYFSPVFAFLYPC